MPTHITHQEILDRMDAMQQQILQQMQEQLVAQLSSLRFEFKDDLKYLEYKLDQRLDSVESRLDKVEDTLERVRKSQVEDGAIFNSMLLNHQGRIGKLEKWQTELIGLS